MKHTPRTLSEPDDVLYRIQRGLVGYISYLAACEVNSAFSEYVLYEPILRILMARGYSVRCECPFPGILEIAKRGDHKRIDFVAEKPDVRFALEIKWAKKQNLNVEKDYKKLLAFHKKEPASTSFLCVFGRWNHTKNLALLKGDFTPRLPHVYALLRATQYGCRIYELNIA
jgi:hypothetical protein